MGCEKSSLRSGFLGLRNDDHCNTPKQIADWTRIGISGRIVVLVVVRIRDPDRASGSRIGL